MNPSHLCDARCGGMSPDTLTPVPSLQPVPVVTEESASDELVEAPPHQLKSAGIDQVLGALRAGGSITKLPSSFYSGGYSYTHVLTTKRGTQYRVSKQVMRWVPDTAIAGQAQP
ncbi:hypothetical protein KYG_00832 [Acidovorax sp. NO-1]|uniref:hypothetical protein n=1 Tax=Acidovorax sp. NO-1 TaxID=512030 RepID=UPI00023FCD72|nr:hypothetical protein [Acidovorax sp. NO-1]EHL24814.1 hypothetical protein KYG_00832 [Acidovorax sp. NO-1]